jgi:Cytochrome c7 and related cytochrome c
MPDLKAWFQRPRLFWIIGAAVLIVIVAVAVVGLVITQAAPPQPFPYPHAPHIAKGIPCLYCHSGAYREQSAGLPTRAKCMGCHNNIKAETAPLKQLDEYASSHEQFTWVPVALLPDFVYFTHQPHLNAQLDCINCHGDVSKMTSARPQRYWDMGWCLKCHKTLAPDKFVKLSDCATCHK